MAWHIWAIYFACVGKIKSFGTLYQHMTPFFLFYFSFLFFFPSYLPFVLQWTVNDWISWFIFTGSSFLLFIVQCLNWSILYGRKLNRTQELSDWLSSAYSYLAMVNYPYPSAFLMPLPAHPIKEVSADLRTKSRRCILDLVQVAMIFCNGWFSHTTVSGSCGDY